MAIKNVTGRMILDSRGIPTVEATVLTDKAVGVAAVPTGTSTGRHEAKELRDGDRRWDGMGVSKAVSHVNVEIAGALKGKDVINQAALDKAMLELDGTAGKSRMGANAILAVSLAALRAAAAVKQQPLWRYLADSDQPPLPVPLCNVIEGGAHADNALAYQEFMIVPHGFLSFSEALRAATETFQSLGKLLAGRGLGTTVGLEGGFAPKLEQHAEVLDLLIEAIKEAGYDPGRQISLAIDVAANTFFQDGGYVLDGQALTAEQLSAHYAELLQSYPIVSIEDPLAEDDWPGWGLLYNRLHGKVQIVGDDLTVTNVKRIRKAAQEGVLSSVILKPNQIGTYTETLAARELASEHNFQAIVSHRSGETNDVTIADLAVGWQTGQIKAGSLSRGERIAKYNRLLAIEQELGGRAVYAGEELSKVWGKHAAA